MLMRRFLTCLVLILFYGSAAVEGALVAHWPLKEGTGSYATEMVSGYDGELQGSAALITGDPTRGNVLDLTGSPDRVELSDHVYEMNGLTTGTITGWFNHGNTSIGAILTLSDSAVGWTEARLFIEKSRLRYDLRDEGGNPAGEGSYIASAENVDDTNWHHVAVTIDGTAGITKLYIDGQFVSQADEPLWGNITDATNVLNTMALGSNTDSSGDQWHYTGQLSDLAIYDTVLTYGQVLDVMQNGISATPNELAPPAPRPEGTIAHYLFDGQLGSIANGATLGDETGNHDSTVLVDTLSYVAGKNGSALHFENDAETSHRNAAPTGEDWYIYPGESFTVESIFRTSASGTLGIVSKNGDGGEFWMRLQDGEVRFYVGDGGATSSVDVQSDDALGEIANTGEWVHVAGVYDSAAEELRLFLNGVLVDTDIAPATWAGVVNGDSNPLMIGDFYNSASRKFIGDIDEVRISRGVLGPGDFLYGIPEPASLVLLLGGTLGLIVFGRYRC